MRTHNTGVVSWIPPCVPIKTSLVRKATGNHLINSTSLGKTQSPVSGFCYARNRLCNASLVSSSMISFKVAYGRPTLLVASGVQRRRFLQVHHCDGEVSCKGESFSPPRLQKHGIKTHKAIHFLGGFFRKYRGLFVAFLYMSRLDVFS